MRRNTLPARSRPDEGRVRAPEQPQRKVFKCMVDDTALIAGVKKSTRDGIRKWVSHGAVQLHVPLYTLTQLNRLTKGSERINADAREAVKWLDEITEASDRVHLEGVDEAYTTWEEVEQFLLPETLLSMEESDSEEDYAEDLESSFNQLDVSDGTSMSSSHSLEDQPKSPCSAMSAFSSGSARAGNGTYRSRTESLAIESPNRTARNSTEIAQAQKSPKGTVPVFLHSLFNHILWRIHKGSANPDAALESFILLTNDPAKQVIAQKFGIRAKRLEQLRDAVGREDREYRNRLTVYKLETEGNKPNTASETAPAQLDDTARPKSSHSSKVDEKDEKDETDSDEDVVLLKRAPRGPQAQAANSPRVWDPNDFGRVNHHGGRGGRGGHTPARAGRGGSPRGRGAFRGAYVPPGPTFRAPPTPRADPNQPIDPDSFARPTPRPSPMRGNRRKLWEPN